SAGRDRAAKAPRPLHRRSGLTLRRRALPGPKRSRRGSRTTHLAECRKESARLGATLLELALRIGVGHDPGAGAEFERAASERHRADEDVEIHAAVAPQEHEGAGVGAAPLALELRDDLHAAMLRAAGD